MSVGADAYPKGTGSGSRTCLAGRRWRCQPHLCHRTRAGEDRVVLPYERLSLPGAIHPAPAVFVTWARRAAGASAPTVGDVAGYHPTGRGGIRHPDCGRFMNRPYGKNTGVDFL